VDRESWIVRGGENGRIRDTRVSWYEPPETSVWFAWFSDTGDTACSPRLASLGVHDREDPALLADFKEPE
jgi:hypothetical protein